VLVPTLDDVGVDVGVDVGIVVLSDTSVVVWDTVLVMSGNGVVVCWVAVNGDAVDNSWCDVVVA